MYSKHSLSKFPLMWEKIIDLIKIFVIFDLIAIGLKDLSVSKVEPADMAYAIRKQLGY